MLCPRSLISSPSLSASLLDFASSYHKVSFLYMKLCSGFENTQLDNVQIQSAIQHKRIGTSWLVCSIPALKWDLGP